MADITSKTAMAPVTPQGKPEKGSGGSGADNGSSHLSGFSSLPSSIHHGLSEKLQGFTEKLTQLGQRSVEGKDESSTHAASASGRSWTSSWGTAAHPNLAVQQPGKADNSICQSPSRTCSRTSSKKSNQSTLISNGKVADGT